jgi:hypothetical protein
VPLQFGRAPAPTPPEAILDVEYCFVDPVLPGEMDGKLSLLLRFNFPIERNRRQEEGGGGTIDPRLGNQKKKEVRVSKQCESSTKTSIAHKQQQQRARGRTNANTQNALTFLIPYRSRTSIQKPSSSSHGGLRCRLTNHA